METSEKPARGLVLTCPFNGCACDGNIRIGDRVRLHSGDYALETPVENLVNNFGMRDIVAQGKTWKADCLAWHQPRPSGKEIAENFRMIMLDEHLYGAFQAYFVNNPKDHKIDVIDVLEILDNLLKMTP